MSVPELSHLPGVSSLADQAAATTLGVDIAASCTGAVVIRQDGAGWSSPVEAEIRARKGLVGLARAARIARAVTDLVDEHHPDLVAVEGYALAYGKGKSNLATSVEVGTVVRYFIRQAGVPCLVVPPTVLKKFVCGRGNAAKSDMKLHVYKRWGREYESDDVADAFGLAALAQGVYGHLPKHVKPADFLALVRKVATL